MPEIWTDAGNNKGKKEDRRKEGEEDAAFPIRQAWRIQKGKCRTRGERNVGGVFERLRNSK